MGDTRIGRPSPILQTLHESKCERCGAWIRSPILRFHVENEHPTETPRAIAIREIPIPTRIVEYLEAGNYLSDAAAACGVGRRTVTRWIEIGQAIDEEFGPDAEPDEIPAARRIYWRFWRAVEHARDAARTHRLRRIAADPDWRAQAWMLERTSPAEFGRVDRIRVGGDPDAAPVRIVQESADPDFVRDVMQIYEEAGVLPAVESASTNGKPRRRRTRKEDGR